MLKDTLSKIITSSPDIIQFAKDRKYEESWIILRSKARPTDNDINVYLRKEQYELLIVEYIWNSTDDENRFVLTVFFDKECKLTDDKKFISICFDLFYNDLNFLDLITSIDNKIIGKPYLFLYPVEFVNMGIFNHWLSVGPVELWQTGDPYDKELIFDKIKLRPDIEKTILNYQGLLFRFNVTGKPMGPYFGFKTPCCKKEGNVWVVDHEKVDYWMKVMLNK